jgi:hypothetical protein
MCEAVFEDVSLEDTRLQYNDTNATCVHCNKRCTSNHNLKCHIRVCKHKPMFQLIARNAIEDLHEIINTQKHILAELRERIRVNTTHRVDNMIVYNPMNSFTYEIMNYITHEFAIQCLNKEEHEGMRDMLNAIYFNTDHKENHNVRLVSLNKQIVEVFYNQDWVSMKLHDAIQTMIKTAMDVILIAAANQLDKTQEQKDHSTLHIRKMDGDTKHILKEIALVGLVERLNKPST